MIKIYEKQFQEKPCTLSSDQKMFIARRNSKYMDPVAGGCSETEASRMNLNKLKHILTFHQFILKSLVKNGNAPT